jgi:hypothetical protein
MVEVFEEPMYGTLTLRRLKFVAIECRVFKFLTVLPYTKSSHQLQSSLVGKARVDG